MEAAAKKKKNLSWLGTAAPYIGVVFIAVLFEILTEGKLFSTNNLISMSNTAVYTAMCSIGAVFVFAGGFFDMSMSGTLCLSAVLGGYTAIATGNLFLAALVILGVCLAIGVIKGFLAAYVKLPFFIFTIILVTVLTAVVISMMGNKTTIFLKDAASPIRDFTTGQMAVINVICLGVYLLICIYLFNYTSLGSKMKNIGGNLFAARQSGIPTKSSVIFAFIVSAIGVATAAFLILIRARAVGTTTASYVGNDVMVALVLGGMPLSGGSRSKISAGIVGALTITILNSGLGLLGLSTGQIQICRGILFLLVVLVSSLSYRSKLLPR